MLDFSSFYEQDRNYKDGEGWDKHEMHLSIY